MRALVTGSSGFVGRYMCAELESRGYEVDRIDLRGDALSDHRCYLVTNAVDLFREDTTYYDLVVHAAYHVGGRATIDGVPCVLSANVELDAALFRWAERTEPGRVIYFSSSAAYPVDLQSRAHVHSMYDLARDCMLEEYDINLTDVEQPDSRYGWAKLNGEMIANASRECGVNVTIVRPFSGYAWDQSDDYPFPSIVKRAAQGDLSVWGPRGQTRDWIHITDVVKGALAVADSGTIDPVNLCTGIGTEMGHLANEVYRQVFVRDPRAARVMCPVYPEVEYLTDKPYGVFYRVGDPARMLQYYTPQISLEQGITEALDRL